MKRIGNGSESNNNNNGNNIFVFNFFVNIESNHNTSEVPPPPPPKHPRIEEVNSEDESDSDIEPYDVCSEDEEDLEEKRRCEMTASVLASDFYSAKEKSFFVQLIEDGHSIERGEERDVVWMTVTKSTLVCLRFDQEKIKMSKSSNNTFFFDGINKKELWVEEDDFWGEDGESVNKRTLIIKRPTSLFFHVHSELELSQANQNIIFFNEKKK